MKEKFEKERLPLCDSFTLRNFCFAFYSVAVSQACLRYAMGVKYEAAI
ncbi:hypothetical protein [Anaerocolumna sp. MB42-C2]|nr:hypothetical protein [Anaerocolumna sp. MB42-C2]WMJ88600.1 hypothetical protein RBU59_03535 [Anaerocolumna sp. MB42-C2]